MSDLIPLFYLMASLALFWLSITYWTDTMRRVRLYFLAFSTMCFGCGRMMYSMAPRDLPTYEWIFTLAHMALVVFVGLYVYAAATDIKRRYFQP